MSVVVDNFVVKKNDRRWVQKLLACPLYSVADPHHLDADPDTAFHFDPDSDPDPEPTFHSDADPAMLYDPLRLPAFHFDKYWDPDPALQNDADPLPL